MHGYKDPNNSYWASLNGQKFLLEVDAWTLSGQIVLKNTQKTIVSFLFFAVAVKYIVP